ncbi:MAG: trypsin-like peptidase domain-containing protein [Acidimicrobiales bacterium]
MAGAGDAARPCPLRRPCRPAAGPPPVAPPTGMFPGPAAFGPPPATPPQAWPDPVPPAAGRPPLTGARLAVLVGLVSAVVAALVTSLVFVAAGSPRSSQPAASAAPGAVPDVAGILDETEASVVSVHTGEGDPSALFGGAGTGVIISDDGLVLTNAHVVNATGGITLTLADGTEVQAELVGSMPDDDVALVQIVDPPSDLRAATLGSSDDLAVGEAVVAIGNALNLGGRPTVTTGILSAKDRTIQART